MESRPLESAQVHPRQRTWSQLLLAEFQLTCLSLLLSEVSMQRARAGQVWRGWCQLADVSQLSQCPRLALSASETTLAVAGADGPEVSSDEDWTAHRP